jgi:hypothetical protein
MATTLLPSSNEGFMGLREKHSAYSKLSILFFNEDPLLSNLGILRNINGGGSLCHLTAPHMRDVAPNQLRGTMNRFEKGTFDLFKAVRKSVLNSISN